MLLATMVFSAYTYLTPYISILSLKNAIEKKDSESAKSYINFSSLRESLKVQLKDALSESASKETIQTPLGPIRMMVFSPVLNAIVESTIDYTITPSGLELLLKRGKLSQAESRTISPSGQAKSKTKDDQPQIKLYYKGINLFILESKPSGKEEPIKAYLTRNRIFRWKLTAIQLPSELLNTIRR